LVMTLRDDRYRVIGFGWMIIAINGALGIPNRMARVAVVLHAENTKEVGKETGGLFTVRQIPEPAGFLKRPEHDGGSDAVASAQRSIDRGNCIVVTQQPNIGNGREGPRIGLSRSVLA